MVPRAPELSENDFSCVVVAKAFADMAATQVVAVEEAVVTCTAVEMIVEVAAGDWRAQGVVVAVAKAERRYSRPTPPILNQFVWMSGLDRAPCGTGDGAGATGLKAQKAPRATTTTAPINTFLFIVMIDLADN